MEEWWSAGRRRWRLRVVEAVEAEGGHGGGGGGG